MGASGSGKTPLLNVISTLDNVMGSGIEIAGTGITRFCCKVQKSIRPLIL